MTCDLLRFVIFAHIVVTVCGDVMFFEGPYTAMYVNSDCSLLFYDRVFSKPSSLPDGACNDNTFRVQPYFYVKGKDPLAIPKENKKEAEPAFVLSVILKNMIHMVMIDGSGEVLFEFPQLNLDIWRCPYERKSTKLQSANAGCKGRKTLTNKVYAALVGSSGKSSYCIMVVGWDTSKGNLIRVFDIKGTTAEDIFYETDLFIPVIDLDGGRYSFKPQQDNIFYNSKDYIIERNTNYLHGLFSVIYDNTYSQVNMHNNKCLTSVSNIKTLPKFNTKDSSQLVCGMNITIPGAKVYGFYNFVNYPTKLPLMYSALADTKPAFSSMIFTGSTGGAMSIDNEEVEPFSWSDEYPEEYIPSLSFVLNKKYGTFAPIIMYYQHHQGNQNKNIVIHAITYRKTGTLSSYIEERILNHTDIQGLCNIKTNVKDSAVGTAFRVLGHKPGIFDIEVFFEFGADKFCRASLSVTSSGAKNFKLLNAPKLNIILPNGMNRYLSQHADCDFDGKISVYRLAYGQDHEFSIIDIVEQTFTPIFHLSTCETVNNFMCDINVTAGFYAGFYVSCLSSTPHQTVMNRVLLKTVKRQTQIQLAKYVGESEWFLQEMRMDVSLYNVLDKVFMKKGKGLTFRSETGVDPTDYVDDGMDDRLKAIWDSDASTLELPLAALLAMAVLLIL